MAHVFKDKQILKGGSCYVHDFQFFPPEQFAIDNSSCSLGPFANIFDVNVFPKDGVEMARVEEIGDAETKNRWLKNDLAENAGEEMPEGVAIDLNSSKLAIDENVEKTLKILSFASHGPLIKEENFNFVDLTIYIRYLSMVPSQPSSKGRCSSTRI
ncbi:hypothetical protein Lal_00041918 [Lupinus albus]|nr:hypothetical protein Lal_00041918 [Lupinus albus]